MRKLLIGAMLSMCGAPGFATELSFTTSAAYSSGRYGGTAPTRAATASVAASATLGAWELSASLPYVNIAAGSSEVTVGGIVVRPGEASGGKIRGFSDILLMAGRPLTADWLPVDVSIQAQLKLPTGSRSISTGKADGGIDVEVSRSFGPVSPFLSAGYRVYGDSADLELENGWALSGGASVAFGDITIIGSYDWSQSPVGLAPAKELFAVMSGPFGGDWNWTAYGSKGLNEGAADLMIGFGVTRRFSRPGAPFRF